MAASSAIGSTPAGAPPSFETVRYESVQAGIARIVMDRPQAGNAERFGMVNQVVPRAGLADAALAMAARIAAKPSFALKMTKEAVNRSVDAMGQASAIDHVFGLHQLCHAHNMARFGLLVDPAGLPPAIAKKAAGD